MIVKSNAPNNFISLPITDVNELESFYVAEVEVRGRLVNLGTWEEAGGACGVLLALIELFEAVSVVVGHLFEIVWILKDVEVVNDVELLVTHFKDIE